MPPLPPEELLDPDVPIVPIESLGDPVICTRLPTFEAKSTLDEPLSEYVVPPFAVISVYVSPAPCCRHPV